MPAVRMYRKYGWMQPNAHGDRTTRIRMSVSEVFRMCSTTVLCSLGGMGCRRRPADGLRHFCWYSDDPSVGCTDDGGSSLILPAPVSPEPFFQRCEQRSDAWSDDRGVEGSTCPQPWASAVGISRGQHESAGQGPCRNHRFLNRAVRGANRGSRSLSPSCKVAFRMRMQKDGSTIPVLLQCIVWPACD